MNEFSKTQIVKKYISDRVADGKIKNGQRLPSCRMTATLLGVNKITVNKAYTQMEEDHMVFSIPRGGFYLIDHEEKQAKFKKIDFSAVKPDDNLIPYREFTHVINKAIELNKNKVFGYEASAGLSSFRDTLKTLFEKDGVYSSTDNIIVTNGAQQAIHIAFHTLLSSKKGKLLVEIPTYDLALKMAASMDIEMIGIERKSDGYNFKAMESILKSSDILAFYIIPRHQNPTGFSLAEKDKKKIAELCNKYNVQIIEDDYLADLGSNKRAMPIYYYDTNDRTAYIRSFSKTFMPGIRIGALILPNRFIAAATEYKHLDDLNTSTLPQAALELFIKTGMYEKHIKKVRRTYENKLEKARNIFLSLCPEGITWNIPNCGIFIWLKIPNQINAAELKKRLNKQGIIIRTAEECFLQRSNMNNQSIYLSLCVANVLTEDIGALATVISEIGSLINY